MSGVLVVGGGITGLSAAWEVAGARGAVTVVESQPRFGGKLRTERVDGYLIEHGPDSFITYKPAALELARELGLADQVIGVSEPRSVSLRVSGRMRPMPEGMGLVLPTQLGPFARTRILSWPQKMRAAADVVLPRVLTGDDMSIGELLRRRLGDGVVERFADPLLGGIYGARVDDLSVDAVLPSLRMSEAEHRSLVLASLAQGRAARRRGGPARSPFRSLAEGMGSLVDALATALAERGADLRSGTSVLALHLGPAGFDVELSSGASLTVDAVILACGVEAAARIVAPFANDAAAALGAVPLGSTTSVNLGFDASAFPSPLVGHGFLEAGPDPAPISGVTISSNKWVGRAPEGKVLIRAFVPDRVGPLAEADDDEILTRVTGYVSSVLGATADPELRHVVRWGAAMPKYVVGHRQRVAEVEAALPSRIAIAGSALNGVGVPDCIADGRRVARGMLHGLDASADPLGG
jgi:protoporphyrinogen/coproporphyrinogen III oxidase